MRSYWLLKRFMFSLCITGCLQGCTANYSRELAQDSLAAASLSDHYELTRQHNWVLPQSSKLYLAYPDASLIDEEQPISRTQFQLAEQIKIQFTRRFAGSLSQVEAVGLAQTFKDAQRVQADFVLLPQLVAISANPYAEGAPKKVNNSWQLNIRLYDARSKKLLDTLKMEASQGVLNRRKQEPAQLFAKGLAKAALALAGQ
jgi:hypothetical protein